MGGGGERKSQRTRNRRKNSLIEVRRDKLNKESMDRHARVLINITLEFWKKRICRLQMKSKSCRSYNYGVDLTKNEEKC